MIIQKIWKRNADGALFITIPKDCDLQEGDYVNVEKVSK